MANPLITKKVGAPRMQTPERQSMGILDDFKTGKATMTKELYTQSFVMPTGAVAGHVLKCSADGTGTWQAPPPGIPDWMMLYLYRSWLTGITDGHLAYAIDYDVSVADKLYIYAEQDGGLFPGGYVDAGAFSAVKIAGDFDVQIEFSNVTVGGLGYYFYSGFGFTAVADITMYAGYLMGVCVDELTGAKEYTDWYSWTQVPTTDTSGKLRVTRTIVGTDTTINWYYWDTGTSDWALQSSNVYDNTLDPANLTGDVYLIVGIEVTDDADTGSCEFFNFKVNSGTILQN
jgi:hypothetical protein